MATAFRFPSPEDGAQDVTFAPDPFSPRKRYVPPGFSVHTTITSRGFKAEELRNIDTSKCQSHRQRYPEVEAIVQMFFRTCAIILNISVLIIVRILDTNLYNMIAVKKLYGVVTYSLLLNVVEFVSLCDPHPTLLIYLMPWIFPARTSTSSPKLQPRFPRLPSLHLAFCELTAIIAVLWSAILFLNPVVENDTERPRCPVATCVTPEEHDMIFGYILEVFLGLVHVGFFMMATVHFIKRNGPGWLEHLEHVYK